MKKFISTFVAFLIVSAFTFAMVFLVNILTGRHEMSGWRCYLVIGLAGGLGGLFGPKVSAYFKRITKS